MSYEINYVPSFAKELKTLSKKYKNIKNDYKNLLDLLSNSENPKQLGISLGNSCYKIRVQNSDNGKGKSGGYRVIYFLLDAENIITLLSIYSKSDIENISETDLDKKVIENLNSLNIIK